MGIRAAIAAAVVPIALAACSTAGTSGGDEPYVTQTTHEQAVYNGVNGASHSITSTESKDVVSATVSSPLDSVWNVLGSVFLDLGVEPQTIDPARHYLANTSFHVVGSLAGVNVSHYLDCGSYHMGSLAQQSDITMSLTVQVVKDSAGTSILRSEVSGSAMPHGLQQKRVTCSSTGQLEARVEQMVTDALKRRTKT